MTPVEWRAPYADPVFRFHDDGRVTVSRFPPQILITRDLLEAGRPAIFQRSGRMLLFRCSGARAQYRLTRRWHADRLFGAVRVA